MVNIEKVTDRQFLLKAEGKTTLEDIAIAVIQTSYELASPVGMGHMQRHETELTKGMALEMLNGADVSKDYIINRNQKGEVTMDYVFGRCCKTTVTLKEDHVQVFISTVDRNPTQILELVKSKLEAK